MTFQEQSDKLIEGYNKEFDTYKWAFESEIKTLIKAGEYFVDYFSNRILLESQEAEDEARKEKEEIQKSINKLKEALK